MRTQTEFRTYPPLSSSAGWGAGNKDQKNEKDEQKGAQAFCAHPHVKPGRQGQAVPRQFDAAV